MVKIVLAFLVIFFCFFIGIDVLRQLSGKEKWALTKALIYSIICASATVGLIAAIIVLF